MLVKILKKTIIHCIATNIQICFDLPKKAFAANFASSELHGFIFMILFFGIQCSYMLDNDSIAALPSNDYKLKC